ncbi:MAG: sulfatase-like hydrolase/transferase [Planctomycetota bacterium]|nr:sulfatase-like hydrolase/transferase [Planctomycetota bacterium]
MRLRAVLLVGTGFLLALFGALSGASFTQLAAAEAPANEKTSAAASRPNIIFVMVDDFGYECVTANGGESYQTPNIDRLAKSGMRFEYCFAQPVCTPTRAQLMTGQYNIRNYERFGWLNPNQTTFAQLFQKAGYKTCIVGKWQLGQGFQRPTQAGFDEYRLWQLNRRPPRYANPGHEVDGQEVDYTNGEYGPDLEAKYALDFIERNKSNPFLLYFPLTLTHDPYQPTPDSKNWDPKAKGEAVNVAPKHFADMVAYTDKIMGRLTAKLDSLGIRDNTLIIFTGDNGTGKKTVSQFRGKPYEGGKAKPTNTGMRVPLIVSWPARLKAGQTTDNLVDFTDFFPTLCDAAGISIPKSLTIDGHSLYPLLTGGDYSPREWTYCWYARDGGDNPAHVHARTQTLQLNSNGRLLDYSANEAADPVPVDNPTAEQLAVRAKLAAAIKHYANQRPAEVSKSATAKKWHRIKDRKAQPAATKEEK